MPCVKARADNGCGTTRSRVSQPRRERDTCPASMARSAGPTETCGATLQRSWERVRDSARSSQPCNWQLARRVRNAARTIAGAVGGGQSTARSRRDMVQAHVHSTVKGQPEGETQGGVTRARSARGKRNPCAHTGQRAMKKARSGARSLRHDGTDEGEAKRKRRSVGDRESRRWAALPREQSDYNERTSRSNGTRGAASWLQSSETRRAGRQSREYNVHGGASPSAEGERRR